MSSKLKQSRQLWAAAIRASKQLTPTSTRNSQAKQELLGWPTMFSMEPSPADRLSLHVELRSWEKASDDDFESFEKGLE